MEMQALIELTVAESIKSLADGAGSLIPFTCVLLDNPDPRQRQLVMTRFPAEYLEQGLAAAQASIVPSENIVMYAIAWDGFATVNGTRCDAVLVEVGQQGLKQASMYAQPYASASSGLFRRQQKQKAAGLLQLVGSVPSRLTHGG